MKDEFIQNKARNLARIMAYPVLGYCLQSEDISVMHRIKYYLFVMNYATKEHLLRICNYSEEQEKNLAVTISRMTEQKILAKKTVNDKKNTCVYALTKKGIDETKKVFLLQFEHALSENIGLNDLYLKMRKGYPIEPKDCVDALAESVYWKGQRIKKQIFHKEGVNDVAATFLLKKEELMSPIFSFFNEVKFDWYGNPMLDSKDSFSGRKTDELIADGLIRFVMGSSCEMLDAYIEHETGTHEAEKIKEKVEKYLEKVFSRRMGESTASVPLLMILLSGHTKNTNKKDQDFELQTRDRYLSQGLSLMAAIIAANNNLPYVSLNQLHKLLTSASLEKKMQELWFPFLDSCITKLGGGTNAITLTEKLRQKKKNTERDNCEKLKARWLKFKAERKRIFDQIDRIPGLKRFFLEGIGLYVFNHEERTTILSICTECFDMRERIVNCFIERDTTVKISGYYAAKRFSLSNGQIVLRNVYALSDGRYIAVENVGDDYGAYYRIKHMFEMEEFPCEVVCIFNDLDEERLDALLEKYKDKKNREHVFTLRYGNFVESKTENKRTKTYDVLIVDEIEEIYWGYYDRLSTM